MNAHCKVDGCDGKIKVIMRQLCSGHYQQQLAGKPFTPVKTSVRKRDANGNKRCTLCREWKPEEAFASSAGKLDRLQAHCRECKAIKYRANRELVRDKMRAQRYNISREQFDKMLAYQGGKCWLCRTPDPGNRFWCVDHDHECCPGPGSCGECVRGILCASCNHALGNFRDDPDVLARAMDYVSGNWVTRALGMATQAGV